MSSFPRNRYSSAEFLAAFEMGQASSNGGRRSITLVIDENEIDLEFPDTESGLRLARSILEIIAELDNLVQDSCESECHRTKLDDANYNLYLASVQVEEDALILGYYGAKVNTEWDAKFQRSANGWEKVNF